MDTSESDETSSSSENDEVVIQSRYPLGYAYKNHPSGNKSHFSEPPKNVAGSVGKETSLIGAESVRDKAGYDKLYGEMMRNLSSLPFPKLLNKRRNRTSTHEEPNARNKIEISKSHKEGKGTGDATSINISPNLSDKESLQTDASGVRIHVNKTQTEVPKTGKKARKNQRKKSKIAATLSKSGPLSYSDDAGLLKHQNKTKEEIGRKKFTEKVRNTVLKSQKEPPADPAKKSHLVPEKLKKSESQNKIGVEQGKEQIENVAKRPVTALTGTIDVLQPNELDNPSDKDQIRSYVDKSMLDIQYNNIFISVFVDKGTQIICKLKQRPVAHVDASDVESCSQTSASQDAIECNESELKESQETDIRK